MTIKSLLVASLLATLSTTAFAGDFYFLGSLGAASADIDKGAADASLSTSLGGLAVSSSLDEDDVGFKLQLGYKFNENFALEAGYFDLGEYKYNATFASGAYTRKIEVHGTNLTLVGTLPVGNQFSVFGKFGMADTYAESKAQGTGFVVTRPSGDTSGLNAIVGLGGAYQFTERFGVRAEWERYNNVGGNAVGGRTDIDLFSTGVTIGF